MNYLAHAYLSFDQPDILAGNMISDFVKGKTKYNYTAGIQKGIALHRAIDEFTDAHPATKKAATFFKPAYRLYSGAFVDVAYDHFLALDTNAFKAPGDLQNFTTMVYETLEEKISLLPPNFQKIFPYMKQYNWLYNYRYREGIEKSFGGLVRRATFMNESDTAFAVFNKNYNELQQCYSIFFPSLKKFAALYLDNLLLA